MRRYDVELVARIEAALDLAGAAHPLPGIENTAARDVLVHQLVESVHRIRYVRVIRERDIATFRSDPNDVRFDPLKAAMLAHRAGNVDEAFWLVFLSVHFGKHR